MTKTSMVVVVYCHRCLIIPPRSKTKTILMLVMVMMMMMMMLVVVMLGLVMMVMLVVMTGLVTVLEKTKYPMSSVNGHFQGGAGPESQWK